jgi:hypothetical protein
MMSLRRRADARREPDPQPAKLSPHLNELTVQETATGRANYLERRANHKLEHEVSV